MDLAREMANTMRYTEKYFELLKERRVKGYLFEEKNYYSKSA